VNTSRAALTMMALAALLPASAAARERSDKVELVNGGRVVCEIISLEFGMLSARTQGLGTVDIEWPDVAGLTSVQLFDVERDDGTRISGHLGVGGTPRTLVVRTSEEEWLEIPFERVFLIRQLGASFWQSRRGRLNVGLDYAVSSDDRALFIQIADKLAIHAALEEHHFYPAVKARRTEDILLESLEDHVAIKRALSDLLDIDAENASFDAKLEVLKDEVESHVEEEETELFPKVRKILDEAELDAIGEEMAAEQAELEDEGDPRLAVPSETDHPASI
jgi:hemerythrin superfamily protein